MDVVKVRWEESEQGWGCRPDGYSLHRNSKDADEFIKDYWDRMPNDVPSEYSRPLGRDIVEVEQVIYDAVIESKNGVRYYT